MPKYAETLRKNFYYLVNYYLVNPRGSILVAVIAAARNERRIFAKINPVTVRRAAPTTTLLVVVADAQRLVGPVQLTPAREADVMSPTGHH
jgi:hypothetical protein